MDVEQVADGLILRAIHSAVVAENLRQWAVKEPDAAKGLLRASEHHSALQGALITEFLEGAANSPLLAHTPTGGPEVGGAD